VWGEELSLFLPTPSSSAVTILSPRFDRPPAPLGQAGAHTSILRQMTVLLEEPEGFDTDTGGRGSGQNTLAETHLADGLQRDSGVCCPRQGTGSGGQAVDSTGESHYLYRHPSCHQDVHHDTTEPRSGGACGAEAGCMAGKSTPEKKSFVVAMGN